MVMDITIERILADQVRQFSEKDKAYMLQEERLSQFWKFPMQLESFEDAIAAKKQQKIDRDLLKAILIKQYKSLGFDFEDKYDISNPNTFTITTAHQPSLMTGPLYFIYKAVSAIKLSMMLEERYDSYNFMPVFVIGGEDHDFEEINHFKLFGKKITWDNKAQIGACGRMNLEGMDEVLNQLDEILGESVEARELYKLLDSCYNNGTLSYGEATQKFVIELFKDTNLTVLSMDDADLKSAFIPVLKKELVDNFSKTLVDETIQKLSGIGFKMQAYPRAINLFYLNESGRNRIELQDQHYCVLNTELKFTENELLLELDRNPAAFSPNVVLRPIYQEFILPNLAYVGGGGELAYWLERKSQFEAVDIPFPVLVRRDSALWIDNNTNKKWAKLGLGLEDWLKETEQLKKEYVQQNSEHEISLTAELEDFNKILEVISEKTSTVDKSLVGRIEAEGSKIRKSLEGMEKRLQKAEKQKFTQALSQIEKLKERLFPNDGLQERTDNFIPMYLKYGPEWINILIDNFNPMETGLKIITA
jgi:bacillithiol biosynthesis cysteine-adding enzyme BshC